MTLAKKGSRRITVDGVQFRWMIRRRPTYSQALGWSPLRFVVERAEEPGACLVAELPGLHLGNWFSVSADPVLPAAVAARIQKALLAGWQPMSPGPPWTMALDDAGADDPRSKD